LRDRARGRARSRPRELPARARARGRAGRTRRWALDPLPTPQPPRRTHISLARGRRHGAHAVRRHALARRPALRPVRPPATRQPRRSPVPVRTLGALRTCNRPRQLHHPPDPARPAMTISDEQFQADFDSRTLAYIPGFTHGAKPLVINVGSAAHTPAGHALLV